MIERSSYIKKIHQQLAIHSCCGLLGPRQSGKTTLSQQFAKTLPVETVVYLFDLEHPDDFASLEEPMRVLEHITGLVILDEVQLAPAIFPTLRVLSDRKQAQYLILGSASPHLIKHASESLAGRIGTIELSPLHLGEVTSVQPLLTRGGFPKSYLAESDTLSMVWRQAYIQSFLERDIPALGFNIPARQLRRFWMMLTHVHGQQLNMHQIGISLGISGHTVRHYLDILEGTFMLRVLQPWFENIGKRQVKIPKLYFRDSGLLLSLLSIENYAQLLHHPMLGAIWEGFALEQVLQYFSIPTQEAFFWRTAQGAELDLFIQLHGKRIGFEFKFSDAPKKTPSMQIAIQDLKLNHLYVIYPGQRNYAIQDKISVVSLEDLGSLCLY